VARLLAGALLLATTAAGCADPEAALVQAEASQAAGDFERQRQILRDALESSPDDVPLLVAAARYYLRPEPEGRYKPRLALHYAMRAKGAADAPSEELSRLMFTAYRAAGGLESGHELVRQGLEAVGHPDAANPRRLRPVDPDLVEPTLANLIEQRRRWDAGPPGPPCAVGRGYIPAGRYPVGGRGEREIAAVCIGVLGPGELATQLAADVDIAAACRASGRRACSAAEALVACTAMASVLGAHPACTMDSILRCCAAPATPDLAGAPTLQ
jgi:hypothetical protein